jgi:hypothetical protein
VKWSRIEVERGSCTTTSSESSKSSMNHISPLDAPR